MPSEHTRRVQQYFDSRAGIYHYKNYGREPKNCHEHNLRTRRQYMIDLVSGRRGKALEVGCGPGVFQNLLSDKRYQVSAADIAFKMLIGAPTERRAVLPQSLPIHNATCKL